MLTVAVDGKEESDNLTPILILAALLGHFKGETGEKCHLVPLPLVTNRSGIKVGKWMETLVAIWASKGRTWGPAFCSDDGQVALSHDFDDMFIEMLVRVQARRPEIFKLGEEISEMHGISQSLHKGSNSEAQATGILILEVDRMNRWRKVEHVAGCQPKFQMNEHYAEVKADSVGTFSQVPVGSLTQWLETTAARVFSTGSGEGVELCEVGGGEACPGRCSV
jgi:hypothetical protein